MMQWPYAPFWSNAFASSHDPAFSGGCEGLAMLSRKNLTLSALVLSNGLNLGTRSRAALADVNLDGQTLDIRTSHHDVMREGVVEYSFSKPKSKQGIPSIPSSVSPVQVQQPSCAPWQPSGWAVDGFNVTEPRPADLAVTCEPRRDDRVTRFPTCVLYVGNTARRGLEHQAAAWAIATGSTGRGRTASRRAALACSATARATTVGK
jgi:hypothetical protein